MIFIRLYVLLKSYFLWFGALGVTFRQLDVLKSMGFREL